MLPLREFVCRLSLALALAKPMRSSREESQKYEEGVLGQAESSQTDCASRIFFRLYVHLSARLSGGKDARKFRICVHDKCYKTGLESPLVGAFRTQLELIEFKLY